MRSVLAFIFAFVRYWAPQQQILVCSHSVPDGESGAAADAGSTGEDVAGAKN